MLLEDALLFLFRILRIPPFVNHKGNDVNSDWLADQWDERSVLGHAQFHKGRMKGDDPEIDTAQTPKRFDRRLVLLGKTRKTFTDSIPNKFSKNCSMRLFCFNFWKGQEARSPTFPTSSFSAKINWELSITSSGSFLD